MDLRADYKEGLTLAQLMPAAGAQLAIYLAMCIRHRGSHAGRIGFVLRHSDGRGLGWRISFTGVAVDAGVFYGVEPASSHHPDQRDKLTENDRKDKLLWHLSRQHRCPVVTNRNGLVCSWERLADVLVKTPPRLPSVSR